MVILYLWCFCCFYISIKCYVQSMAWHTDQVSSGSKVTKLCFRCLIDWGLWRVMKTIHIRELVKAWNCEDDSGSQNGMRGSARKRFDTATILVISTLLFDNKSDQGSLAELLVTLCND